MEAVRMMRKPLRSMGVSKGFILRRPAVPQPREPSVANMEFLSIATQSNHSSKVRERMKQVPSRMAPRAAVFHSLAIVWLAHGPVVRGWV